MLVRSMSVAGQTKNVRTACAAAACIRVPVCVFVLVHTRACALVHAVRACAHVHACVSAHACVWVDVLCVPMTIRSVTNAIVTTLTREMRSVWKPDLHMLLRSWCTLVLYG
jgi:hypothetical protein